VPTTSACHQISVVCMDKKPYQLLSHTAKPLPMELGKPQRTDYEYIKIGTCSIL